MKKLIFLIPFIFILFSCGENNSASLNGGNGTGGDGSQASVSGGDVTNPDGSGGTSGESGTSGSGGTSVDVKDPEGGTGGDTTVVVDPGGDTGSGVIVDIDPGGDTGQVVIVHPDEEELKLIHNTIFDYINRDNLYYRSTLSENEKKYYDRLYDSFVSFYGRTDEEEKECTAGVLCHATDAFVTAKCIDDTTGFELANLSKEDKEFCTPEEVKKQYDAWADTHCHWGIDGSEFKVPGTDEPVCGWDKYHYKESQWFDRDKVGVSVGFLDMPKIMYSFDKTKSTIAVTTSIEKKLMLDLHNLYLFRETGVYSPDSIYYKVITSSSCVSDSQLKEKWIEDMNYIQERIYYSIINYTKSRKNIAYQDFGNFLEQFKQAVGKGKSYQYAEDGAQDISAVLDIRDGKKAYFDVYGLSRLFAFACQIGTDYQCTYVEGKANYSDGFGNHGGQEFDHAWVRVRNDNIAPECSGAIIIDPLRFYEEKTLPYLCTTDAANAGYKPSVE